ncbi:MAG: hypothetical protein ABIE22_02365 [archaeon]
MSHKIINQVKITDIPKDWEQTVEAINAIAGYEERWKQIVEEAERKVLSKEFEILKELDNPTTYMSNWGTFGGGDCGVFPGIQDLVAFDETHAQFVEHRYEVSMMSRVGTARREHFFFENGIFQPEKSFLYSANRIPGWVIDKDHQTFVNPDEHAGYISESKEYVGRRLRKLQDQYSDLDLSRVFREVLEGGKE